MWCPWTYFRVLACAENVGILGTEKTAHTPIKLLVSLYKDLIIYLNNIAFILKMLSFIYTSNYIKYKYLIIDISRYFT